ncbi:PhzF family phenazine biosynthesis protein [Novosphingobium pokkalii]|uniref:PhzF family phenazine biosynthesis protein n=1 Tax=Novosphingobium pokkalii TaxID=1770194 RepID=A0ABV7UYP0_9SPHN|nr:PhzF family phenazine biosynthesis protein [Novosphingobium pokkalii]GHD02291.1 phenazine biosynthesis protein PhzF [Novosphingobium pokkalii]
MLLELVDVFASGPLSGNPLAVVRGGEALDTPAMLALTQWLGFSETTFLLPPTDPGADYRVRIFYPAGELPFAGHPTLGSAQAWLMAGGVPRTPGRVVQECGVGLVEVRVDDDALAFRAPPLLRGGPLTAAERAEAIRVAGIPESAVVEAIHACNGPGWRLLRLESAEQVLAARPVAEAPVPTDVGLIGPCLPGAGADFELRAFFSNPQGKIVEDPVTGSLNAAAAQVIFAQGLAKGRYVAAQGRCTGADGRVELTQDADGAVWVAGRVRMVSQGGHLA